MPVTWVSSHGPWFEYSQEFSSRLIRSGFTPNWRRFTGLFRSADLNAVGWIALLGPRHRVGLASAYLFDWPQPRAAIGGTIGSWLAALAIDTVSWRRGVAGFSVSELPQHR